MDEQPHYTRIIKLSMTTENIEENINKEKQERK